MKILNIPRWLLSRSDYTKSNTIWCIENNIRLDVNDIVEIRAEGEARGKVVKIDVVIIKRLSDVNNNELAAPYGFPSVSDMMTKMQHIYGTGVELRTPVNIISYSPIPDQSITHERLPLKEAKLYTDGGSRGNPGPSACGYVIYDMRGNIVVDNGTYIGITTNNQAEYQALKLGLEAAADMGVRVLHVYMDSLLVVNQMMGVFKVKNRDLWPIHESIKLLTLHFKAVNFTHIPRELNTLADSVVNKVLDDAERKT